MDQFTSKIQNQQQSHGYATSNQSKSTFVPHIQTKTQFQQEMQNKIAHQLYQDQIFFLTNQQQPHHTGTISSKPLHPVTTNAVASTYSFYPAPYYYQTISMPSTSSNLSSSISNLSLSHGASHGSYRQQNGGSNSAGSTISSCSTMYSDSVAESEPRQKIKVSVRDHDMSELCIDTTATMCKIHRADSPISPITAHNEQLDVLFKVSQSAIDSFLVLEDAYVSPDIELYGADIINTMKDAE
ncbi:hypothetical protein HK096_009432, partial [Nowakowskiella sp. JEL0078]